MTILVTGADGQLGKCLQKIAKEEEEINFIFKNSSQLDITIHELVLDFFSKNNIDFCINCAAYTQVDNAEKERDLALKINAESLKNIAAACKKNKVKLLHISTDFVFSGDNTCPYKESDTTQPINYYGFSKLQGEENIKLIMDEYYIIRTSWLYSEFGNNFMKTMLRLSKTNTSLSVVNDQTGSPTNALDLADVILRVIKNNIAYGIYHYCNDGETTWYKFTQEIFKISKSIIDLKPIKTSEFPTLAKRPKYSVLSTSKIQDSLQITIPHWKESLEKTLTHYSLNN